MPNFPQVYTTPVLTNASESAANTETVVATLSGVQTRLPNQNIILRGWVSLTSGAAATAITLRLRRDSLTGTLVKSLVLAGGFTAAAISELEIDAEDSRGEGSFTYVVTMQGTGEGGAATFGNVELTANVQ